MHTTWVPVEGTPIAAVAIDSTMKPHLQEPMRLNSSSMCGRCTVHLCKVISLHSSNCTCKSISFNCDRAYSSVNSALETQGTRPNQCVSNKTDHLVTVLHNQRTDTVNTMTSGVKRISQPPWMPLPPATGIHCNKRSARSQQHHGGQQPQPPVAQRSPSAVPWVSPLHITTR